MIQKKTVIKVNKAIPTVIPLVQASLTSYTLQPFLVQVDMGTTMYDVSSYNPQTVEPITPYWLNHAVYDGPLSHTLDGFVPPAEVQDRRMQTAAVHVQPLCHRECCRSHIRNHCGNRLLCPGHRLLCPWHCRCKCSHTFWGVTFYVKCDQLCLSTSTHRLFLGLLVPFAQPYPLKTYYGATPPNL